MMKCLFFVAGFLIIRIFFFCNEVMGTLKFLKFYPKQKGFNICSETVSTKMNRIMLRAKFKVQQNLSSRLSAFCVTINRLSKNPN